MDVHLCNPVITSFLSNDRAVKVFSHICEITVLRMGVTSNTTNLQTMQAN